LIDLQNSSTNRFGRQLILTPFGYGGNFNDHIVANFLSSLSAKNFSKIDPYLEKTWKIV